MFDDLQEMEDQVTKQYTRLQELRKTKADNLSEWAVLEVLTFLIGTLKQDAYLGIEDPSLHNVDVMTDVSTPFSTFTRYTMAPTSTSRSISK